MAAPEIIPEDDVTIRNLQSLFERAFINVDIDEDGDLQVRAEGLDIYLDVRENIKLLGYSTYFPIKKSASLSQKYALANKMNDSLVMVRFSIFEDDPETLIADYHLSFENGISAFQVIATLRMFSRLVERAIRENDEDDLVE